MPLAKTETQHANSQTAQQLTPSQRTAKSRWTSYMNVPQKVVLLLSTLAMVFVLLFMDGMNYDGIGAAAAGGIATIAAGIYILRKSDTQ